MTQALTRSSSDVVFKTIGDPAWHVDAEAARTHCTVIVSQAPEVAPDFAVAEQAGSRTSISVRECDIATVLTGDTFEVDSDGSGAYADIYRVDARMDGPGQYHCITLAVTSA